MCCFAAPDFVLPNVCSLQGLQEMEKAFSLVDAYFLPKWCARS